MAVLPSAHAASSTKTLPIITTFAAADSGLTQMTIGGISFTGASGSTTIVTLGSNPTPLQVTAVTNMSLTVLLPSGVQPGSYLMTVSTTNPQQTDEFWVTIGAVGPKGDTGAQGPQGIQGPIGLMGPTGPTGAAGAQGPKGDTGAMGPQGAKGDTGAAGPQGPVGPMGSQGPIGATGAQGPQGPAGADGATGPAGSQGATGPQGPGFVFQHEWNNDAQYMLNDVVTYNGGAYVALKDAPAGTPDQSTDWKLFAAAGAAGAQGEAGPQGPAGPHGPQGAKGDTGAVGPQGPAGATGPQGSVGPVGAQGTAGPQGEQGPVGPQGPAGTGGGLTYVAANGATVTAWPGNTVAFVRMSNGDAVVAFFTADTSTSPFTYDWHPNPTNIFYSGSGCTGTQFVNSWGWGSSHFVGQTTTNGHVLLLVGSAPSTRSYASYWNGACQSLGGTVNASAVESTIDLTALYPGPLSAKLQ
jgi:hypothetical protein